ncbi:putative Phosphotyrosyl phosphatase activator protein [Giardia muris]|uniref:Serine/threonine-protein phosphatase 2A activator n=1 Tax=Giardia muris TaxID=5742 RepID=A0A4Z1SWK3_GIAMU|nr:putative Phosphotyrosyl phosphatase activator protein [Giardia muris]|eukprot:TNJ27908.1 putative Phosphotyrosyl phosphatase activator protein [Giardia muris]
MDRFRVPPETFVTPEKTILNRRFQMDRFRHSVVFYIISQFITMISQSIEGLSFDAAPEPSPACAKLLGILEKVEEIFKETPPVTRDVRYGNPSFRTFIGKLRERCTDWHRDALPEAYQEATIEIDVYFLDMFGSEQRLDYGTGHELNFVCWVFSFARLQVLESKEDMINIGLRLAPTYLRIVQNIQNIYTLEPAGSHGAWSVDDYNMLPFVWGSAQLFNKRFHPIDIFNEEKVEQHLDNLYNMMIHNIFLVKTGDLRVTSPFISEIHMAADTNWQKIHSGMYRHYQNEVLCKWPIMQHFWFGSIIPFE